MSILIVDDNAEMRGMIREIIGDLADEVLECADGATALEQYVRHLPDWVLMDLRMPGMDGIEATRRILVPFPDARVVVVTDFDDPELRRAALAAGAAHFVSKENLFSLRGIVSGL